MVHHKNEKITVHFYMPGTHQEPVKEWLKDLDRDDRRTIGYDIKSVEIGWPPGYATAQKNG